MRADVGVLGGGSGGFGAALAAARLGLNVALVEREPLLGGTSTAGGVSCWEPGVGGTGIPFELYARLRALPARVGVYSMGRHFCWQDRFYWPAELDKVNFPGGEARVDPVRLYADTLRRHPGPGVRADEAFCRAHWHGVLFEPAGMAAVMREMLDRTGRVAVRLNAAFESATVRAGRVTAVRLSGGETVEADFWIDATGDGVLAAACGAGVLHGRDPRDRFGEPGAPERGDGQVNGVTRVYRIAPADMEAVARADEPDACWWARFWPPAMVAWLPDGTGMVNMLPTMEGREWFERGPAAGRAECERRVRAHWRFVQTAFPEFRRFRLHGMARLPGIRESNRIVCERMLTEQDVRGGLSRQRDPDVIAVADHALDRHAAGGGGCGELDEPYGIPFRCLIPRGLHNLLVACRAAGFSSRAASSARLSRTMMQLGQAAGTATALARAGRRAFIEVEPDPLRAALRRQGVQLEWPTPPDIRARVAGI